MTRTKTRVQPHTLVMYTDKAIAAGATPIDRVFGVVEDITESGDTTKCYSAWKHSYDADTRFIRHAGTRALVPPDHPSLFAHQTASSHPTGEVFDDSFYTAVDFEVIAKRQ